MNKLTIAALTMALLWANLSSYAQTEAEMKAMMAYSTPGEIHQMLAKTVGSWSCNITTWMEPGAPPMTTTSEMKSEMILDGRYLQSTNKGSFAGMPFQGISLTGYDNAKKVFVNTWIDNMGTGIMYLTGSWDAPAKTIRYAGTMADPASGKDIPIKEVITFVDDKTQLIQMYSITGGKEFKTMEIKCLMQ